jgi:hypothetical protein
MKIIKCRKVIGLIAVLLVNAPALSDPVMSGKSIQAQEDCADPDSRFHLNIPVLMEPWLEDSQSRLQAALKNERIPFQFQDDTTCDFSIAVTGLPTVDKFRAGWQRAVEEEFIVRLMQRAQPLSHLPDGVDYTQRVSVTISHSKVSVYQIH